MSWEDARQGWRARTLTLRCDLNPPNAARKTANMQSEFHLTTNTTTCMISTQWNIASQVSNSQSSIVNRQGGLNVDGRAEIRHRGTEVTEMMPRSVDENPSALVLRAPCVSRVRFVQNKANFRMAQSKLTSGQKKGYVKTCELAVRENKANLPARACSVPVRASVGAGFKPARATTGGCPYKQGRVQNKANFWMPQSRLTVDQERGYVKRHESAVCENKANLRRAYRVRRGSATQGSHTAQMRVAEELWRSLWPESVTECRPQPGVPSLSLGPCQRRSGVVQYDVGWPGTFARANGCACLRHP